MVVLRMFPEPSLFFALCKTFGRVTDGATSFVEHVRILRKAAYPEMKACCHISPCGSKMAEALTSAILLTL